MNTTQIKNTLGYVNVIAGLDEVFESEYEINFMEVNDYEDFVIYVELLKKYYCCMACGDTQTEGMFAEGPGGTFVVEIEWSGEGGWWVETPDGREYDTLSDHVDKERHDLLRYVFGNGNKIENIVGQLEILKEYLTGIPTKSEFVMRHLRTMNIMDGLDNVFDDKYDTTSAINPPDDKYDEFSYSIEIYGKYTAIVGSGDIYMQELMQDSKGKKFGIYIAPLSHNRKSKPNEKEYVPFYSVADSSKQSSLIKCSDANKIEDVTAQAEILKEYIKSGEWRRLMYSDNNTIR
jgi:hypothetical protein